MSKVSKVVDHLEMMGYSVVNNPRGQYINVCFKLNNDYEWFLTVSHEKLYNEDFIIEKIVAEMNKGIKGLFE